MGSIRCYNTRFFRQYNLQRRLITTDRFGNEIQEKELGPVEDIYGKLKIKTAIDNLDSRDEVTYDAVFRTNTAVILGDVIDGREVVKFIANGLYGLR